MIHRPLGHRGRFCRDKSIRAPVLWLAAFLPVLLLGTCLTNGAGHSDGELLLPAHPGLPWVDLGAARSPPVDPGSTRVCVGAVLSEHSPLLARVLPWSLLSSISVSIRASQTAGFAPASVSFEATPGGGTPPYTKLLWSFGDSTSASGVDAVHAFGNAGNFEVRFDLQDSAGATAFATTWVNLSSSSPPAVPAAPPSILSWVLPPVLGAGSAALVLWVGLRWQARSARRVNGSPSTKGYGDTDGSLTPNHGQSRTGSEEARVGASGASPPAATFLPPQGGPRPTVAQRRLTQEVLVHLYTFGRWSPDTLPPAGATQGGISSAIGSGQSALSNVLRRLEAAGFLTSELTHASGRTRRVKAYRLTPRGESLARTLPPRGGGSGPEPSARTR
ncbi:MAG: PKD domain-containing protein [Thermoplasmata archaeon]|nr:PKD domain-containing protein [Thermoplasmata archaeon]